MTTETQAFGIMMAVVIAAILLTALLDDGKGE